MAKKNNTDKEMKSKSEVLEKEEKTKESKKEVSNETKETANNTVESDNLIESKVGKTAKSKQAKKSGSSKAKDELKNAEEKNKELHDKYLRLSAEFDNYRKRTLKEKMDLTKYASEEILRDLLPVVDDFERAYKNITAAEDLNAVKEGMTLINNKFNEFLKQKGLSEIEAMHQDFNMDVHEAITKVPAPEEKLKGKIIDVIEKGYMLNDKVVRYSKVVIGE